MRRALTIKFYLTYHNQSSRRHVAMHKKPQNDIIINCDRFNRDLRTSLATRGSYIVLDY